MKHLIPMLVIPALALADGPRAITVTSVVSSGERIESVSLAFGAGRAGWTFNLVAMSGRTDCGENITAWAHTNVVATIGPSDTTYFWIAPAGFWNDATCLRFALVPKSGMPYDNRIEYVTKSHSDGYWIDTGVRCTSKQDSYRLETDASFTQSGWFGANYYLQLDAGFLSNSATKSNVVIDYNSAGDYALHCYQDGKLISDAERNWSNQETPSSVMLAMWALGQNDSTANTGPTGSIWTWKVWKNGELVSDIVPVVANGKPRIFDRMTGAILKTDHFDHYPSERGPDIAEPPDSTSGLLGTYTGTEIVDGIEWTYTVFGNEAVIGGGYGSPAVSKSTTGALAIPATLGGRPVTGIGDYAFDGCAGLTDITIPDSVTSIGFRAFRLCSGLTLLTIPASVESIGERAFVGCSGLTSFSVSADNPAFMSTNGCLLSKDGTKLIRGINGDITIPTGVTVIGAGAFAGCSGLRSISIPDGVMSIGDYAFQDCSSLGSISIPDSVATIGHSFEGCSGPTSIVIPYAFSSVVSELFWDLPASCQITFGSRLPLVIATDAALPDAREGFEYTQGLEVTGGLRPYSFELVDNAGNPTWLSVNNWILEADNRQYDFFLEGLPYTSDIGTNSFTLRVTDAEGTSVEKAFTIVVRPGIVWTPASSHVRINPGTTTNFKGVVSHDAGIEWSYEWSVERPILGEDFEYFESLMYLVSGGESFTFNSANFEKGNYRIVAYADNGAESTWHFWFVTVAPKAPLAIETDAVLTKAKVGYFYNRLVITGGEAPYRIEIPDRDNWPHWLDAESIGYTEWGEIPLYGYPGNDDIGQYNFTIRVTDAEGTSITKTFTIVVEENTPPVIASWTPEASRFRIDPGATTNFSVIASDPDEDDLWFYWDIYKQAEDGWSWFDEIEGSESFEFASDNYGDGRYRIECWANDGYSSDWHSWIVTIAEPSPLAFATDSNLPPARAGNYRQEIKIVGGEEPYVVEIVDRESWPDWLETFSIDNWDEDSVYNANPFVQGWPDNDDVGTHSFALRVTDAEGASVAKSFTVVVASNSPPVIDSWTPETTRFRINPGISTNFTVTASDPDGDALSFRWSVYEQGDNFGNWWGLESGPGSESFTFHSFRYGEGLYRIEVVVDDGAYSESQSWSVTVAGDSPLAFAMGRDLPSAKAYWYYNQNLKISGGTDPYMVEIVDREIGTKWLRVNYSTDPWGNVWHYLSGNPSSYDIGEHSFTLRVTDAKGTVVEKTFTVVVEPNSPPVIESSTPEAPRFRMTPGTTTNFVVTAFDPDDDELSYDWSVYKQTDDGWDWMTSGGETNDLSFDSSRFGLGRYEINVYVSDGGVSQSRSWTFTVGEKTPLAIVTDATLPAAKCGWYYSQPLKISGGEEPYSVEILDHDAFPDWLWSGDIENLDGWTNDDPRFYGHPYEDDAGTYSFTLRVTDAEGTSVEKTFTLVVLPNASPVIEACSPKSYRFRIDPGTTTNFVVTASDPDDDDLSYYWSIYRTTENITSQLASRSGANSFTFNASTYGEGRYRIEASVSDGGYSVSRSWTIVVAPKTPLVIVTDTNLPTAKCDWYYNYSQPLVISGGEEPYSVEILDHDAFPDWLWTGDIENLDGWTNGDPRFYGHPYEDDAGTYSFMLRVTDAEGKSVEKTFTLVVAPNSPPVIEAWTPESPRFRIDPGAVTNFSVTASDSDDDELSYEWVVFRTTENRSSLLDYRSGTNSFAFNSSAYGEGRYEIYVSVGDGGHSTGHSWIIIVAEEAWTMYTPAPVPYTWLERYYTALDTWEDYEDRAFDEADNGVNAVWECYVAGLDPTNATSRFFAEIDATVDPPRVTWTPDLNEGGTKHERVYTVEGKTNLVDSSWGPTNESTRFFRVRVEMP